jgi:AAA+ ATPase superfamily predicted ATPase
MSKSFIGRTLELEKLAKINALDEASIIIIYGRRRVGKTSLIEEAYKKRRVLKIEGIEGQSKRRQIQIALDTLATHVGNLTIAKLKLTTWLEFFNLAASYAERHFNTLYFEELQWLACYRNDFVSELKHAWDNQFQQLNNFKLILCGSSPSFMIRRVVRSKALYNRSQHEIHLREFSLEEARELLGHRRSIQEVMDAYLLVGGIPEYLKKLTSNSSVLLSLTEQSFRPESYFVGEYDRIFVSSLSKNPLFKKTIELLAENQHLNRLQIAKRLGVAPGGGVSRILEELELCGFIVSYAPVFNQSSKLLRRYCIADNYLQFYYKFIKPKLAAIHAGAFKSNHSNAISYTTLAITLGFAFERFALKSSHLFATMLGFGSIQYNAAPYFNRAEQAQYDLVFDRADKVISVCELKYRSTPVGGEVVDELNTKIEKLNLKTKKSIEYVLISTSGYKESLHTKFVFSRFFNLEDIFMYAKILG